ncbi:hypothetical protein KR093_010449 [Drosophila rubida]|uniref:Dynein axonemal assembly factor 1 homolog n=1 Tax=Drosophila rubida TaxID=30044 RepID=A0AAD4K674_9MUSC|nr:hypothetical protein KR093_010449 [Drosophila rubida]
MAQTIGATQPRKEVTGLHRMTQKGLRDLCKKDKLYQTPRLNDVLYLHYQGYQYIECLEEYTELKCLWLECNAISEIEGLENQSKLKCLFLQNNLIKRIDNLRSCPELDTLNLSSNHIRMIENIGTDILPVLNTLNISSNYLKDSESIAHLVQCKTLAVLDLSNNRIEDILVVKIFEQMPCLKVLVLQGNPVVSRLPQYRKTLILACKELTYLDSRPVFPRDRACAEAWKKDGYEGERKEHTRWIRAERKKMRDSVNYTIKLRNRHRPPEEQDALITSSDSETEQEADSRAEQSRIKADVEYGCVDDIWREVEGDENDPESSVSSGSGDDAADKPKSRRRHLDGRPKILDESQLPENQNKEEQPQALQQGKRLLIEEVKLESLDGEDKSAEMRDKDAEQDENEINGADKEEEKEIQQIAQEANDNKCDVLLEDKLDENQRKDDEPKTLIKELPELISESVVQKEEAKQPDEALDSNNELQLKVENDKNIIDELPALIEEHGIEPDDIKEAALQELPELIPEQDVEPVVPKTEDKVPDEVLQAEEEDDESKIPIEVADEALENKESDSELDSGTDLEQSTQTLASIVYDKSPPTPEEIKQKCVDEMYRHYGSEIFKDQPESIHDMLDEKTLDYEIGPQVCCVEPRKFKDSEQDEDENEDFVIPKTQQQLDYEEECAEANEKLAHDLQELSDHLDEDLGELVDSIKKLHEEHEGLKSELTYDRDGEEEEAKDDQRKCVELTTVVHSLRIIEEFTVRRERISDDQKKQETTEMKYAIEEAKAEEVDQVADANEQVAEDIDAIDYAFAKALDDASDDVPKRVFGAGCDTPSYKWEREECMRQLTLSEEHTNDDDTNDDDEFKIKPLTELTSAEEAEKICEQLNKKLAADEESLRDLLQELEDEVNVLHNIDDTLSNDVDLAKIPEPEVSVVCRSLLDELIDELQYREIINGHNIKCFDFGLIESDEEYSYSAEPKVEPMVPIDLQDPAAGKSLRECLDAFGNFLGEVKERKYIKPTKCSEKVAAAKKLLKSRMLPDVPPEELDAVLAKQEEKTKRRVAEMASRCFAKRESYEDSLEVVDNRLMIVKKNTGELEELPPPPALISDSESESDESDDEDYDTADDEDGMHSARSANSRRYWAKPCQPEPKEQQENDDESALDDSKDDDTQPERSLDEFYSLEARSAFNSLDTEFLEKLDLKKVIGNDGEITVEGMRDYMQLQNISDPPLREQPLTLEEDEMLRSLIDRKKAQEERERKLQELENVSDLNRRLKFKSNDSKDGSCNLNEPNKLEHQLISKFEDLMGQLKEEPEGEAASSVEELCSETDKNPIDSRELEWEQEKREYQLRELPNPDDLGPIKLTRGSCTIYERRGQISDTPDEDEVVAAPKETIGKTDSETEDKVDIKIMEEKETKDVEVIEDTGVIEDKAAKEDIEHIEDKDKDEHDNKAKGDSEDLHKLAQVLSSSIDDDIVSDTSTDYESGEDIPVVEPPKLPQCALNELISTQFEEGLKLERECEEALRKELFSLPLRAWASQENVCQITEIVDTEEQTINGDANVPEKQCAESEKNQSVSDSDTETEGAIGELAQNAKLQWAKISKRLNEFIDSDDLKLLEEKEFDESNDEDDNLIDDLATLQEVDEDIFEECVSQLDNFQFETEYASEIMESATMSNLGAEDESKVEDAQQMPTVGDADEGIAKEANNAQSEQTFNAKPTIRLEYFDAVDPEKQAAELDNADEVKTEEIECNLEILNDDGDAVVKEINVNAQVTYGFQ